MKSSITSENVARYVVENIIIDSALEKKLRIETSKLEAGGMISGSDVGSFLGILAQSIGAKRAIEVGTFTGYTALKVASVLPKDGKLICCDISPEWTSIGQRYWQEAGVSEKIDLKIAPAVQTLQSMISNDQANTFDFAFIDADKKGYDNYYELCLKLLRSGGIVVLDNMLWDGAVADTTIQDETTQSLRKMNEKISQDDRVNACLLTVGDGLMLARKK